MDRKVLFGLSLALLAAASYGGSSVLARHVINLGYGTPLVASAYALLFGTLFLLVPSFRDLPNLARLSSRDFRNLALAGALSGAGGTFLYFGLEHGEVIIVAPVSSINPLISLVLVSLFLKRLERVTAKIVIGTLMVIGGVVLVIVGQAR
jgi:drug/metabolite transporter (DMT)-like permease